jgi:anti-sigma28 factor (negative regulator of flagellin synthesis)
VGTPRRIANVRIGYYQKQIDTALTQRSDATNVRKGSAHPASHAAGETVKLNVSARAKELASSRSSVDEAKVARLQSAFESGSLHHDAASVARSIVEDQYGTASDAG